MFASQKRAVIPQDSLSKPLIQNSSTKSLKLSTEDTNSLHKAREYLISSLRQRRTTPSPEQEDLSSPLGLKRVNSDSTKFTSDEDSLQGIRKDRKDDTHGLRLSLLGSEKKPQSKSLKLEAVRTSSGESISTQRALQEQLTEEMRSMASRLRHDSMLMKDALSKDNEVVDNIGTSVAANASSISKQNVRLAVQTKKATSNTLFMWAIMLVVTFVFLYCYILIRFTR
mmetsp:Transcript_36657/g.59246  ORF Transcript_36657/g.59246 Transcript_36657/m.59246 type:complete len:226 (-) Transcript_36657:291-968(-)|eukprot:CAMPEP_0184648718 /NCGR_PEP_ID=MMETSP0308-20130426/5892_1 /TAXON_ID=38269 /ORGANISM="Gloeochaete witrockiana, Strain SAG 46.84" /LENGTH=225 /DNA_ID=CAMNT_0027080779 /DNA_START=143 /DNA_END=820 /DNA_ORIENTATION=-